MGENIEGVKSPEVEVMELKKRYWELNTEDYKKWEDGEGEGDAPDSSDYRAIQTELVDITMRVAQISRDSGLPFDHEWVLWKNRPTT